MKMVLVLVVFVQKGWIGERFNGIPEPMPDYQKLPKYHYKSVIDTSLYDDNNKTRETDDFLPRPNIAQPLMKDS